MANSKAVTEAAAQAAAPPGSAAAVAAAPPPAHDPAAPVTEKLNAAQAAASARVQAEQAREQTRAAIQQRPSIGRIVHYIAPDRRPRVAVIVRVWEDSEEPPPGAQPSQERTGYVNLLVYPEELGDNQLARQTALTRGQDGFCYYGHQIPIAREPHDIHRASAAA